MEEGTLIYWIIATNLIWFFEFIILKKIGLLD
jgi:hypothetical protein